VLSSEVGGLDWDNWSAPDCFEVECPYRRRVQGISATPRPVHGDRL